MNLSALLTLLILPGTLPAKKPVDHAIEAWARTRKLYLEHAGRRVIFKAAKSHCYDGVELQLGKYSAKAFGKDGHDCSEPERFELAGFVRPDAPPVWLVTFDSAYGSNVAAYILKDGKLRPDASVSVPTASDLLPAELKTAGENDAVQTALRTIEPHYYLDEKGVRAELEAKQLDQLCALHGAAENRAPDVCGSNAPRVIVKKWNSKIGAFEDDPIATKSATEAAIAHASATLKAVPRRDPTPAAEEDTTPKRRPLR